MNKTVLLLFILIPHLSSGQSQNPPDFFLNSKPITIDSVFFNPKCILSVRVERDTPNGQVFLETKDPDWKYLTIDQLLIKSHFDLETLKGLFVVPIYFINGKLINKKSDIKIDSSYFAEVALRKLYKVKNINVECQNIIIVDITLTDMEPVRKISIRGSSINELLDSIR